jgi:hypothetical protein
MPTKPDTTPSRDSDFPSGYAVPPRRKAQSPIYLHRTLLAVIRKEAAAKHTTQEAVIAERFGVPIRTHRKNGAKPPPLDC